MGHNHYADFEEKIPVAVQAVIKEYMVKADCFSLNRI